MGAPHFTTNCFALVAPKSAILILVSVVKLPRNNACAEMLTISICGCVLRIVNISTLPSEISFTLTTYGGYPGAVGGQIIQKNYNIRFVYSGGEWNVKDKESGHYTVPGYNDASFYAGYKITSVKVK